MRHGNTKRKFGREKNQRNALLKSLALNLIIKEKIRTTEAKAKELRPYMEKLVTRAKIDSLSSRRVISSRLFNRKSEVKKLFEKIAPRYKDRNGGYVRIMKLGARKSDAAPMAILELV